MAKKDEKQPIIAQNVINQSLDEVMSSRFGAYSKYVIQERALPDVRDGLKPVQRRILFSMSELGLLHNKPFKKSARVVGDVIGKYHPHGDSSIYEAMIRMSQNWKINTQLVEMHGNNGSIDDDPAAAMRYTEARLSNVAEVLLKDIKKKTVKFSPNFDDSEIEPTILPGTFPNLLVNGAKGIASGFATEMPPHNLSEVCSAIIKRIKSPNCTLVSLMKHMKGPDFPTGGIIEGVSGIYSAFEKGRGKIVIKSRYHVEGADTKEPAIVITETPYGVVKQNLVRDIDDIRYQNKIHGIKEVIDASDRKGIQIFVHLEKDANIEQIINYLLSKTQMRIYYSYNNICIHKNAPTLMNLPGLIDAFIDHQTIVTKASLNFELEKDTKRLEIIEGLIKVTSIVDEVIKIVRASEGSKKGVVQALIDKFEFTHNQANAIAELRLYRLSKTDQGELESERDELTIRIKRYEEILADSDKFNDFLISKMKDVKKQFGIPRKSDIEEEITNISINIQDLIKHEDVYIIGTRKGYLSRFSVKKDLSTELSTFGLKQRDTIIYFSKVNTSQQLLAFTNMGRFVYIPIHKMKEEKWKAAAAHINNFALLHEEEEIVDIMAVDDFDRSVYLTLITRYGRGKRVKLSSFKVSRYSKPLVAIKLVENDSLIGVRASNGYQDLIIISSEGKAVKYSETNLSILGTKSAGIKSISLPKHQYVASFCLGMDPEIIGMSSTRGGIKRIKFNQIPPSIRTSQGREIFSIVKTNPHIVIDARVVSTKESTLFKNTDWETESYTFGECDISNKDSGFSLITKGQIFDGKILVNDNIDDNSKHLKETEQKSVDEVFVEAEKKVAQIDIDELLKGL